VDDSPGDAVPKKPLVRGAIYQVERVGPGVSGRPVVWLYGRELDWVCWRVQRFRPIYRPKSEIIEALKQPVPEIVREPERA
jgi:hypothetical protein